MNPSTYNLYHIYDLFFNPSHLPCTFSYQCITLGEPGHNQHILKRSLAESVMFTNTLSNYNIISSEGKTYSIEYPSSGETAPYKIGH